MIVAGVDGTKRGWVAVVLEGDTTSAFPVATIDDLLKALPTADAIAIDMPIGFLDEAQRGGRVCEQLARQYLPGRSSSVFSSPVRAALQAESRLDARRLNRESSPVGSDLSAQSFALFPKILEVDGAFSGGLVEQDRLFETHPEVAFAVMARKAGKVLPKPKTWFYGMWERLEMLDSEGIRVGDYLKNPRALGAADNDILDAAACTWSARRRVMGEGLCLPAVPPVDSRGLRMEMWI